MSFQHVVWTVKTELTIAAHSAIVMGLLDSWSRCRRRRPPIPHEPDLVAGLVLESTPLMWKAFREILEPFGISLSLFSVFCHQTPKVRYEGISKTSTEIGDLLLVHIHRSLNGRYSRNALLYQAKVASNQPYEVPANENHQLRLYTEWPEFEYYRSPPLSGETRAVVPHAPHLGAQYLLIDNRHPADPRSGYQLLESTYPVGSCLADTYLNDHNHFAGEIVDFLRSRSGRPFEGGPNDPPVDGWSSLVWDLIRVSLKKVFNRRRSGRRNTPRVPGAESYALDGNFVAHSSGAGVSSTLVDLFGIDNARLLTESDGDAPTKRQRFEDERPETGISLVLLESSETGEEAR